MTNDLTKEILDLLTTPSEPDLNSWEIGKKKIVSKNGKDKFIFFAGLYKNCRINSIAFTKEQDFSDPDQLTDKVIINFSVNDSTNVPPEALEMTTVANHEIKFKKLRQVEGTTTLSKTFNQLKKRFEENGINFRDKKVENGINSYGREFQIINFAEKIYLNILVKIGDYEGNQFNTFEFLPLETI